MSPHLADDQRSGADGEPDDTVWYVAYGSNLCRPRLQRYLDRLPDRRGPLEVRSATLPHRLFFAHESRVWGGGGSAFVDPAAGDHTTLVRAWRLTRDQFLGVLARENGCEDLDVDPSVFALSPGATAHVAPGRYGLVLACESPDHRSALTFTTPMEPLPRQNAPGDRYVATIVEGLVDGHSMTAEQARAYLDACCP